MLRIFSLAVVVIGIAYLSSSVAAANTVYRTGETVSVSEEQLVDGDFYVTAGIASMSGTVTADMYAAAGNITINGTVNEDIFVVAGSAQVHATVGDDVRIIAGDVTVAETITGDLMIIGGSVKVLSTASVQGDVLFFGGDIEIAGPIGGNIMGAADRVRIDSRVGGTVDVRATQLTLGDRADIGGDVLYVSPRDIQRSPNAIVVGDVALTEVAEEIDVRDQLQAILIPLFILLFAALTLYVFLRPRVTEVVLFTMNRFWLKSLVGLMVMLATPLVVSLLLATVIGILIGLLLLVLWIGVVLYSLAMLPITIGAWLSQLAHKQMVVSPLWIVVGALALETSFFIPVVGVLVFIIFLSTVVGTIVLQAYRQLNTL
ncbi:MAG: hypothetical protein AAGA35_01470 [Patescibacteria group bacterium]